MQIILTFHLFAILHCVSSKYHRMNRYRFLNISAAFERKILNIEEAASILKRILYNLSRIRHASSVGHGKRKADLQVKICIACFLRVYSN